MHTKLLLFLVTLSISFPSFSRNEIDTYPAFSENTYLDTETSFASYSIDLYNRINDNDLDFEAFKHGLKGFTKLQQEGKLTNNKYLTIIDMSISANTERFFIINMETYQLEHKSLVAHGKNTGGEYAKQFSNIVSSYKTSLGFYKTAETYTGKHGHSLRLDGLEFSNNKARERAVVIHEAKYVSNSYIQKNGRLGRSFGCPSLPKKNYKTIISKIKNGSCLFIYYPEKNYLKKSKLVS